MLYKSLQAGRAAAAILVVLFHIGETIAADKYFGIPAFKIPFSFGSAGVEFFFVLSGFIILTAHRQDISKPERVLSYIRKRVVRIYPSYWIIFLCVYFLALTSSTLRSTVPQDFGTILKSLLLVPQEKSALAVTGAPVLSVAWTLQYEILFYAFFATVIFGRLLFGIVVTILIVVYISYFGGPAIPFPISFLMQDYMWLFAMGVATAFACELEKPLSNRPVLYAFAGAGIFLFVALDTVAGVKALVNQKTILYGVASSLIIFGITQAERMGRLIGGCNWIQLLGESSYALYLIHFPLISILCKASLAVQLNRLGVPGALISYFTILGACIIASIAFHKWVEKPISGYFRARQLSLGR